MSQKIGINDPCSCGSGKAFKHCCYQKKNQTHDGGKKVQILARSLDSVPTHNSNGIRPDMTKEEIINSCIEAIHPVLTIEKVIMLADVVDKVVQDLNIIPNFSYREIGMQMENDGRFEVYHMQVCSLKVTDPIELILDKFEE